LPAWEGAPFRVGPSAIAFSRGGQLVASPEPWGSRTMDPTRCITRFRQALDTRGVKSSACVRRWRRTSAS
jgi:hypothetical protein